jgi:hypothetical protein
MKNKTYHTGGTVPKSNSIIVVRGKLDTPKKTNT